MSQTIFIQLTTAGPGVGPFDIYSVDSFGIITGPFEVNISAAQLLSGFISTTAPNNIDKVRLVSKSTLCPNILVLPLPPRPTTTTTLVPVTTTTTVAPTTTTTSTSTTTTTTAFPGFCYSMFNNQEIGEPPILVPYLNISGVTTSVSVESQETVYVCGLSFTPTANMTILSTNLCNVGCPATTSTSTTSTSTTTTTTLPPGTTTTTTISPIAGKTMCYSDTSCEEACQVCLGCEGFTPEPI
jgi:hypothetical protein